MNAQLLAAGRRFIGLMERVRLAVRPVTDRWLGSDAPAAMPSPAPAHAARPYAIEAAELLRPPSAGAGRIVRASMAIIAILLLWSAFAQVNEVARADARVIPSRQLQVVQSLDGGVVSEILAREGQQVEAGELLLRIDPTRYESGVRESAAQAFALAARQARLKALAEGTGFQPPPAAPGEREQQRIVDEERRLFHSRMSELDALLSIAGQQLAQRRQELAEVKSKQVAAQHGLDLAQQELLRTRPLLASGAVSEVDVLRLEREVTRSRGDVEQAAAQAARLGAAIEESQRKIVETELSFRNDSRKELSEVLGKLSAMNQGAVALADRVTKSLVRSPVRGRVQRLLANTVGGVVQPGKDIVEIVPLDDTLVLEARVAPRDIAFVHPGEAAMVKLTAYDFSIYGGLPARVTNISPDTQVDEHGNAFYVVRVQTDRPGLDAQRPVIPGMTAEVDILTGSKTVLSYLLKPVLRARQYALTER